jgi:hypothetical protein
MENIRIAYSRGSGPLSLLIRKITRSDVNHALFLFEERGVEMIAGADWNGLVIQTRGRWERKGNRIADVPPLVKSMDEYIPDLLKLLDAPYDYTGLIGMIPVEIAKFWFHKRIRNPFDARSALFCSETGAKWLRAAGYPGADKLDPAATDPGSLKQFQHEQYELAQKR